MATGHRSHGWGRPLLAALVALVAVLGTAGFAAAAPAPAETTYRLYFEARLCPLPLPPLTGPSSTSYVALCRLASDERAVVKVGLHEGQAATFQLPFYTGRAHYPRQEFTLDGSPRTIGIKAHGTGSLVLRAVVCQWFNDKPAWDDLPFTLPLNGKTARLDWAIPAPQAQYAIVGLACALLLAPPA